MDHDAKSEIAARVFLGSGAYSIALVLIFGLPLGFWLALSGFFSVVVMIGASYYLTPENAPDRGWGNVGFALAISTFLINWNAIAPYGNVVAMFGGLALLIGVMLRRSF